MSRVPDEADVSAVDFPHNSAEGSLCESFGFQNRSNLAPKSGLLTATGHVLKIHRHCFQYFQRRQRGSSHASPVIGQRLDKFDPRDLNAWKRAGPRGLQRKSHHYFCSYSCMYCHCL